MKGELARDFVISFYVFEGLIPLVVYIFLYNLRYCKPLLVPFAALRNRKLTLQAFISKALFTYTTFSSEKHH